MAITVYPLPNNHEGLEEKKSSFSYEVGSLGDPGPNTKRIRDDTLTSIEIEATWVGFIKPEHPQAVLGSLGMHIGPSCVQNIFEEKFFSANLLNVLLKTVNH